MARSSWNSVTARSPAKNEKTAARSRVGSRVSGGNFFPARRLIRRRTTYPLPWRPANGPRSLPAGVHFFSAAAADAVQDPVQPLVRIARFRRRRLRSGGRRIGRPAARGHVALTRLTVADRRRQRFRRNGGSCRALRRTRIAERKAGHHGESGEGRAHDGHPILGESMSGAGLACRPADALYVDQSESRRRAALTLDHFP